MKSLPHSAPASAGDTAPHVLVIGGGASGVLIATHILAQDGGMRVTIVEAANILGCGLAYSTSDPDHLLNTRVANMSAFPDDPDHFLRWLHGRGIAVTAQCFVSRQVYGAYLSSLLEPWRNPADSRLVCLRQSCVALKETPAGVEAVLEDGRRITADRAVLATGHATPPPDPTGAVIGGWQDPGKVDPEARIVIVGSGLSMVDQVLSLLKRGHRGQIVAVSRRGLLPRSHSEPVPLPATPAQEVPFGAPVSALLRWLRTLARQAEAAGGTWRDAVDGMRPHVAAIWQAMTLEQRARFLRHAVSWWEVHRHRIPPASATRIEEAMARGQLVVRRGAFLGAERLADGGARALVRLRGQSEATPIDAARIIDCRGIRADPSAHPGPLIAGLLAEGKAQVDALRLGFEVDRDCRLIGRDGQPSQRILTIGPTSKAAFWEMTAIPDIRCQAAGLARQLIADSAVDGR